MSLEDDALAIPGYSLKNKLGHGGMATVYLATQDNFGRQVALKIMSERLGEDSVWAKRFIREAQVIAQLSHPNIVPVFDVGTHDGRFYIAMEHMKGGSLKRRMRKGLTMAEIFRIIVGVAAGLDYAGEKGFVHRDIKPDNIMFREDGSPVILDFGIVKEKGDEVSGMTQTGTIVGTTSYMSPEQAQGRELDERSDIYALGIMFYELLLGHPPFQGDSSVAVLMKHVSETPEPLPRHLSALQAHMDKLLAKNPSDRYARARDFIAHIEAAEKQIATIIKQDAANRNSDQDQATCARAAVKASDDSDATQINPAQLSEKSGPKKGRQNRKQKAAKTEPTNEFTEITQVLSSAKATIKDFSAEAREKKAKRTRNVIMGMSTVAMLAIAFVGFQQLYIAPKERAAAEAKLQETELRTANKVKQLLSDAASLKGALRATDLPKADEVIAIYREILQLDPENSEALGALESLGNDYVEMAQLAAKYDDLDKAETFRDYAEQLSPKNKQLTRLRLTIKSKRAVVAKKELDAQFKGEKIDTLLEVAERDIRSSKGFSISAYAVLQQVLRLEPNNTSAVKLVDDMVAGLRQDTASAISKNHLSRAEDNIEMLKKYDTDAKVIASLESKLSTASRSHAKSSSRKALFTKAAKLKRERRTVSVNDELRNVYLSILKMEAKNTKAKAGLNETSQQDEKFARQALNERDFPRAREQADIIKQYNPSYQGLNKLNSDINNSVQNAKRASELLLNAEAFMKRTNDKRASLSRAYKNISQAKVIDAHHPKIKQTLEKLEGEYLVTITELMASKRNKEAANYFKDTSKIAWPTERLMKMQLAHQNADSNKKPKPKRVITGGF